MKDRREPGGRAFALMVLLCAIWGLQQVAIKAAATAMAPVLQVALRSCVAAVAIGLLVVARDGIRAFGDGTWRPGLLVGFLFAMEFLCVSEGLGFTGASHMVIYLYTAPVFAALGLHLRLPEERLSAVQWAGIGVSFVGVVVSFTGRRSVADGGQGWFGDLLGILAGAAWGATTLTVRFSRLSEAPARVTLLYQLVGASVLLLPVAMAFGETRVATTPLLIGSLAFQIVMVSLISFLTWFALLRTYLASRLGVLSFMTPLFGVGFGVAILGEALDPVFIVGALLVLSGIMLVSGRNLFDRTVARRPM